MFSNILSNIVGTGKKIVDDTEQIDDKFYGYVMDELAQDFKDQALVGKAIAQSNGDKEKLDSIYMRLRAKALQEEAEIAHAQQTITHAQQTIVHANQLEEAEIQGKKASSTLHKQGYLEQLFKTVEMKQDGKRQ